MHHGRAREVHVSVSQVHAGTELREPAAAPCPASEDRIEKRTHEQFTDQERPERDALADGTDDDVAGGLHEHHLEQREAIAARVIAGPGEEEAFSAEEAPLPA